MGQHRVHSLERGAAAPGEIRNQLRIPRRRGSERAETETPAGAPLLGSSEEAGLQRSREILDETILRDNARAAICRCRNPAWVKEVVPFVCPVSLAIAGATPPAIPWGCITSSGDWMDRMAKHRTVAAALALAMAGCAEDGDMSSMPPVPPAPETPIAEEERRRAFAAHPEFRNQYGLERVKAHYAYARGATGEGVSLGIVDTGIDPDHPKFSGRLETDNPEGYDPDFDACEQRAPDGACLSLIGHGTHVGGIMAARRQPDAGAVSENAVHGVAFDARVISVGFPSLDDIVEETLGENPTPEQIRDLPALVRTIEARFERQIAAAFERLNGKVTAVNASFGLPGNIEEYDAGTLRERFPNAIGAIAQTGTPPAKRTIYVWAAGNAHGEIDDDGSLVSATSVEVVAGLPARIPELRGHSLAVVATDRQHRVAGFSNRCGIAKDFCLAAPGVDIAGPVPSVYCADGAAECYLTLEEAGTSSAAPFVTGGIGLLAQHYRGQLGNDEIVARLLATADRTGAYADADIYGQGFLDLDAATRPVGETRMLTRRSLSGPSAPGHATAFHPGAAFGDSLTRGLADVEVASFDELDAPFFRPLGDYLRSSAFAAPVLAERLRALGRDPRGAAWRSGGTELRLRLNADPTSPRGETGHRSSLSVGNHAAGAGDGTVPGSPGSLSLAHDIGDGKLLFGYRAHPGWRFGLYAGGGTRDRSAAPLAPGTFTDDGAFANPFLGFARNGAGIGYATDVGPNALRIAAFHGSAQFGERRDADAGEATGVLTEYRFGDSGLAVQAGWLAEAEAAVGSRPSGAFGAFASDTAVAGLSAHRPLADGWTLFASAHAGMSHVEIPGRGMVRGMWALWTGTFAVGLMGEDMDRAGGRLAVRLTQPLRVESGKARLRWVSGRTPGGGVTVEDAALHLEPSGRQLDLELVYARPLAGGQAHLAAIASRDAGHVQGENEAALLARYRLVF